MPLFEVILIKGKGGVRVSGGVRQTEQRIMGRCQRGSGEVNPFNKSKIKKLISVSDPPPSRHSPSDS